MFEYGFTKLVLFFNRKNEACVLYQLCPTILQFYLQIISTYYQKPPPMSKRTPLRGVEVQFHVTLVWLRFPIAREAPPTTNPEGVVIPAVPGVRLQSQGRILDSHQPSPTTNHPGVLVALERCNWRAPPGIWRQRGGWMMHLLAWASLWRPKGALFLLQKWRMTQTNGFYSNEGHSRNPWIIVSCCFERFQELRNICRFSDVIHLSWSDPIVNPFKDLSLAPGWW